MLERCPVCRARLRGATLCPRCGAALRSVAAIAERAAGAERMAIRHLAAGRPEAAAAAIRETRRLRRTPLSAVLAEFIERFDEDV